MEMGMNTRPPIMSREDFETRKADIKRKREIERRDESRDFSGDRDFRKEMTSNEDAYSLGPKSKPRPSSSNSHLRRHTGVRPFPPRHCTKRPSPHNTDLSGSSSKYKSSDYKFKDSRHYRSETSARSRASESPYLEKSSVVSTGVSEAETNHKKKAKVFSRISFPEEDSTTKKRKGSSSKHMTEYHDNYKKKVPVKSVSIEVNEESSVDEDRHFKRRRARYD